MPQWVFLTQLFNAVIVKDRVALAASGVSTRVNLLRRVALSLVTLVGIICAIGFTVSYFGNRALVFEVKSAQGVNFQTPPAGQAPAASDLERLNGIGQLLDELSTYRRDGAPFRLRWGLYMGNKLYPQACKAYARGLNQLVLDPTRKSMATRLEQLRYKPPVGAESENQPKLYNQAYSLLKTYLIATNQGGHAKRGLQLRLGPLRLLVRGPKRDPRQEGLVREQFDRYANGLASAESSECFVAAPIPGAVTNAQDYLNSFPPQERIYQAMLSEARPRPERGSISTRTPTTLSSDHYKVRPAFTKAGWTAMS